MDLTEFLANVPPGAPHRVTLKVDVEGDSVRRAMRPPVLEFPNIRLHCTSKACSGTRHFESSTEMTLADLRVGRSYLVFAIYVCKDCESCVKTFALKIVAGFESAKFCFDVQKLGEEPAFGPPVPAKAMSLIGGDRTLFLKGRRCETQGLGVGAFSYYRRVIETQKSRIFDEFIRVLRSVDPSNPVISDLEKAKNETQFSTSFNAVKHALPASLLINGQNPIQLLHAALSQGLHAQSDESCLEVAGIVRTILFATAERLDSALKDDQELNSAISLLNSWKQQPNG